MEHSRNDESSITVPQKVRYFVRDVIDFSSQYGKESTSSYTVSNIRSRPHYYPKYGDFLESCVLRTYGPWWSMLPSSINVPISAQPLFISQDFIEVQFEHRLLIESIIIYETYNPGSVVCLYAFDYKKSKWVRVWSIFDEGNYKSNQQARNRVLPPKSSRKFEPELLFKNIYTDKLRLELEDSGQEYYSELDAVEAVGVLYDFQNTKNAASNLRQIANAFRDPSKLLEPLKSRLSSSFHRDSELDDEFNSSAFYDLNDENENDEKSHNDDQAFGEDTRCLDGAKYFATQIQSNLARFLHKPPTSTTYAAPALTREMSRVSIDKSHMTSCSNIVELPNEILNMILSYLDLKTLFKLRSTCTTFYNVCSDEFLFKRIDLQPYWHLVDESLIEVLARLTKKTTQMNLSWTKLRSCDSLERLVLGSADTLQVLMLEACTYVDGKMLQTIATNCHQLRRLSLKSCTSISNLKDPIKDAFGSIKNLKNLETLNLYRTQCSQDSIVEILFSCTRLRHLNLGSCVQINDFDEVMSVIATNCHETIESLDLWRAYSLTQYGLNKIASSCFKLRELDIGWCRNIYYYECLELLVKNCRELRKLFMTSLKITDRELEAICKYSNNLEQLDILGSHAVTPEVAEKVLKKCKNLKFYDISFCSQIDMITQKKWSTMYPDCSIKKSFQSDI